MRSGHLAKVLFLKVSIQCPEEAIEATELAVGDTFHPATQFALTLTF
jgi:hypothetical protein